MSSWKLFVDEIGSPSPYPGRAILGKAPVLLASVDLTGNVHYISTSWQAILGSVPEWKTTRPLHELIAGEREVADTAVAALLDSGSTEPVEFNLRFPDGAVRRYIWHRRYDPEEQLMYIAGEEAHPAGR
jgi:PAS domain-containing protein